MNTVNTVDLAELLVGDAGEWRRWLGSHHSDSPGIWLVLAKRGTVDPTTLSYDEALEEAICFGWIDGQLGRRDTATFRRRFTPRKARSPWSQRNAAIAERLIGSGRMHPSGQAAVQQAKRTVDGRPPTPGRPAWRCRRTFSLPCVRIPGRGRCSRCSLVRIGTPSSTGSETPRDPKPARGASTNSSRCWPEVRPSTPRFPGHPSRRFAAPGASHNTWSSDDRPPLPEPANVDQQHGRPIGEQAV